MRNLKYIYFAILLILVGCTDDAFVKIDSIYKYGAEFYQGQKIQVWVGVETSNPREAIYEWSCDGGSFSGPAYFNQTVWIAPKQQGEYTVSCKVTCNGKSDIRSTLMKVNEYFFENFDFASSLFTATSATATFTPGSSEAYLVGSLPNTRAYYSLALADTALFPPITLKADVAWRVKFKASSSLLWRLVFAKPIRRDGTKVKKYIREIKLETWPTVATSVKNYALSYEVYSSEFGLSTWVVVEEGSKPEFTMSNGLLATDKRGMRAIMSSIDGSNKVSFSIDGVKVLETNVIQDWRMANSIPDKLNMNNFSLGFMDQSNVYFDNFSIKTE